MDGIIAKLSENKLLSFIIIVVVIAIGYVVYDNTFAWKTYKAGNYDIILSSGSLPCDFDEFEAKIKTNNSQGYYLIKCYTKVTENDNDGNLLRTGKREHIIGMPIADVTIRETEWLS